MGTVFKKTATKPLPAGAKIIIRKGERLAEWIDAKRKRRTAPVTTGKDGTERIVITARTYTAKFRDGSGIVKEVATGCRDEQAARSVLSKLERRAELVKGEVLTAAEDAIGDSMPCQFAPTLVPTTGKTGTLLAIVDRIASESRKPAASESLAVSAYGVKQNNPLTTGVNGLREVEPKGIEPSTSWMQTRRSPN